MSTALRSIQNGETPEAAVEAAPPAIPEAARREAPEVEVTRPKDPAECRLAKAERERQEMRIEAQRGTGLANAEARISRARAAMSNCVGDDSCAIDGKRVLELQSSLVSAEAAYEVAYKQIGVLEADLFAIDKRIRQACGQPDR